MADTDLTVMEAAVRLRMSRERVLRRMTAGDLVARKDEAGRWRITLVSIEALELATRGAAA